MIETEYNDFKQTSPQLSRYFKSTQTKDEILHNLGKIIAYCEAIAKELNLQVDALNADIEALTLADITEVRALNVEDLASAMITSNRNVYIPEEEEVTP